MSVLNWLHAIDNAVFKMSKVTSRFSSSVNAVPGRPARAVRPTRWTYVVNTRGTSYDTTQSMSVTSIPRDIASVLISLFQCTHSWLATFGDNHFFIRVPQVVCFNYINLPPSVYSAAWVHSRTSTYRETKEKMAGQHKERLWRLKSNCVPSVPPYEEQNDMDEHCSKHGLPEDVDIAFVARALSQVKWSIWNLVFTAPTVL